MNAAAFLALLTRLLPSIEGLVHVAEGAFSGVPKSGAQKAAMVNGAVQAIVQGGVAVATGGAADSWKQIAPVAQILTSVVAGTLYPPAGSNPS